MITKGISRLTWWPHIIRTFPHKSERAYYRDLLVHRWVVLKRRAHTVNSFWDIHGALKVPPEHGGHSMCGGSGSTGICKPLVQGRAFFFHFLF